MPGSFMKGALVQFMDTFLVPMPNVIIFQYNPETITHTWTPAQGSSGGAGGGDASANPLAVAGTPGETFTFTISMEATDQLAEGNPIALASGIYSRLAALEMLMFPVTDGAEDSLVSTVSAGASDSATRTVPQGQVPTVLFVWGPGRILPVRVTSLVIIEKLYDALLSPIHAEAQLTLKVLTPDELEHVTGPLKDIAKTAYTYSQGLREVLAVANLANAVESIVGMLPV